MKKFTLLILFALLTMSHTWAQSVVITESDGWLESAYVKWEPLTDATFYNVYCKEASAPDSEYEAIDNMLIREYEEYFRADVVGLKAGSYVIKIVPIFNESEDVFNEDVTKQVVSGVLSVKSHVREGFAFSQNSTYKTASGAYNDDGTLRSDAKIFYLTAETANTISTDVIVNSKGGTETRTGIVDILAGKQKGYDKTPMVFRIVGEVKASKITGLNSSGYIQVKGESYDEMNYTIEGIGDDATINGWGILIRGVGNVEVRNIGVMNFQDDGISLDTKNENIWIHNVDFFYGEQGSGDKIKGDGSLDLKENSRYLTLSYNHFWDSGKASLCGMKGETTEDYATYHHNWFDHSDSRHPRVRTMTVHVYNNYYDGIAKYGVGSTTGASIFVENNYFRNATRPMLISLQGTDIINGTANGTFSSESGGVIKSFGNKMVNTTRTLVYHTQNNLNVNGQWDAIETATRDEQVPDTYKTLDGNNTYNNFDTNTSLMYDYAVETADDAKDNVIAYAGRINGGDFKWTFNNSVDDASYDVNSELRTAVNNYNGTVVAIGGKGGTIVIPPPPPPEGDVVHVFATDEKTSTFFSITGNTASGSAGGTIEYNGSTLSKYLKIESSTKITFTTTEESTLTLMLNSSFNGKIKINGTDYTVTAGVLELDLPAGSHTIEKKDTAYLFVMSVKYKSGTGIKDVETTDLVLYPNPVVDNLYISTETEVESVDVYSITGVRVLQVKGNVEYVNMSSLSTGSYIVNVNTVQGSYKKIIIKK